MYNYIAPSLVVAILPGWGKHSFHIDTYECSLFNTWWSTDL